MKLTGLFVVLILLGSCVQGPESGPSRPATDFSADGGAGVSQWLDQRVPVAESLLFSAAAGSDIRQAAFVAREEQEELSVILIARDYSVRVEGQPDQGSVNIVASNGDAEPLELPGLPLTIATSPDRKSACIAVLGQTGVGSFSQEAMSLTVWGEPELKTAALETHALPVTYLTNDIVQLRGVDSFQLEAGLLAPAFTREGGCYALELADMDVVSRDAVYYLSASEKMGASLTESFDPANPLAASVEIALLSWPPGLPGGQRSFKFPLHVSYSPFSWLPQLDWLNDDELAALVFMPELATEGRKANFQGLFKLVVLDKHGSVNLIEDHLNGDLPFHASGGLLFYTRRVALADSQRWEAWASSADGMYKRLVWSSSDPVYISLEDADADQALLLHVQTLEVFGSEVGLKSELLQLRLGEAGAAVTPPNRVAEESAQPQVAPEQVPMGAPPPISMPDTN